MAPRMLGLAVARINFLVNAAFTSAMVVGSISALTTAFTLLFFALGIIGQSLGSALFPTLAALAAENDMTGFRARLVSGLRSALFLAIPATVMLIMLGEPLVTTLFERGEWRAESSAATAWALAFYATGMTGFVVLELLSRAFYALEDTRTPVTIGVAALLANILLSLLFIRVLGEPDSLARGPFAGLALANALATNLEALLLWWLLRRRLGSLGGTGHPAQRAGAAAGHGGAGRRAVAAAAAAAAMAAGRRRRARPRRLSRPGNFCLGSRKRAPCRG